MGTTVSEQAIKKFFGAGLNCSQNVARIDKNRCIWGSCYIKQQHVAYNTCSSIKYCL